MNGGERGLLRVSRSHPSPEPTGSPAVALRVREDPGSPSRALRHALADPLVQDTLIAALLTAASFVGLLAHFHVDLPEGGTDARDRSLDTLGPRARADADRAARLEASGTGRRPRGVPPRDVPVLLARLPPVVRLVRIPPRAVLGGRAPRSPHLHPGRRRERRVVLLILSCREEPIEFDTIFAECLVVGAVWFIGDGLRSQADSGHQLEDRATRLEREREEAAREGGGRGAPSDRPRAPRRGGAQRERHRGSVGRRAARVRRAIPRKGARRCARSRTRVERRSWRCAGSWGC